MPSVRLRPFVPPADLPRLRDWLGRPHVAAWWGPAAAAYAAAERRPADAHAIVMADGRAVGYVCWERPALADLEAAGIGALPDGLVDVDALIGEAEALGRGIGTRAGALLLERLRAVEGVTHVGVGVAVANERSVRAAARLGFRAVRAFEEPGVGPCQYLVRAVAAEP